MKPDGTPFRLRPQYLLRVRQLHHNKQDGRYLSSNPCLQTNAGELQTHAVHRHAHAHAKSNCRAMSCKLTTCGAGCQNRNAVKLALQIRKTTQTERSMHRPSTNFFLFAENIQQCSLDRGDVKFARRLLWKSGLQHDARVVPMTHHLAMSMMRLDRANAQRINHVVPRSKERHTDSVSSPYLVKIQEGTRQISQSGRRIS